MNTNTHETRNAQAVVFYRTEGKCAAIAYKGRSRRRAWHYSFAAVERMEAYMAAWLAAQAAAGARRSEAARQRAAELAAVDVAVHFKVGDIVQNTWGYEQTNVDFYTVRKVSKRFLHLEKLETIRTESAPLAMYGTAMPGEATGETKRASVFLMGTEARVKGLGWKWNGKPVGCSWYA